MVETKEVKVFQRRLLCDHCQTEMEHVKTLLSNPAQYVHWCPKCHFQQTTSTAFPSIEYREIN